MKTNRRSFLAALSAALIPQKKEQPAPSKQPEPTRVNAADHGSRYYVMYGTTASGEVRVTNFNL